MTLYVRMQYDGGELGKLGGLGVEKQENCENLADWKLLVPYLGILFMDVHSKKQRSYNMSQIKSQNTKPEVILRKLIWNAGVRGYRIHAKNILGRPDIWIPRLRVAIFVDGCFWHGCKSCKLISKTNRRFWRIKISNNIERDRLISQKLRKKGIRVIRLKEHEIKKNPSKCVLKINKFLWKC